MGRIQEAITDMFIILFLFEKKSKRKERKINKIQPESFADRNENYYKINFE
jgi:hypothetical protein